MFINIRRRGVTASGPILVLLLIILSITIFNGYILTNSIKTSLKNDAFLVNKLGQIRGSIQRYVKLKTNNVKNSRYIQITIDNDFKIVANSLKTTYIPENKKSHFYYLLNTVKDTWKEIKNETQRKKLIALSEDAWEKANRLTTYAQFIAEYKNNIILKKITYITIFTAALIMIIILVVYFVIKKGLEKEKIIDPLTKLYNRRNFIDNFNYFIELYERYKRPFSIIFLDIDNFKNINDTFGHQKGDEILKEVSKFIINHLRNTDLAFRYGGEEIVIILPETELYEAYQFAERLREGIKKQIKINGKPVTVSIGVGTYKGEGMFSFIERVDSAVYEAKKEGKDKVVISEN
jgi:diguanylate cyclase (GGDEF)-like protein